MNFIPDPKDFTALHIASQKASRQIPCCVDDRAVQNRLVNLAVCISRAVIDIRAVLQQIPRNVLFPVYPCVPVHLPNHRLHRLQVAAADSRKQGVFRLTPLLCKRFFDIWLLCAFRQSVCRRVPRTASAPQPFHISVQSAQTRLNEYGTAANASGKASSVIPSTSPE